MTKVQNCLLCTKAFEVTVARSRVQKYCGRRCAINAWRTAQDYFKSEKTKKDEEVQE